MGSQSDWKILCHSEKILKDFKISYEKKIISAHRTPERLYEFANVRYEVGWNNLIDEFDLGGTVNINLLAQNNLGKIKLNSIVPDDYPWQGKYFIGTTISLDPVPEFEKSLKFSINLTYNH